MEIPIMEWVPSEMTVPTNVDRKVDLVRTYARRRTGVPCTAAAAELWLRSAVEVDGIPVRPQLRIAADGFGPLIHWTGAFNRRRPHEIMDYWMSNPAVLVSTSTLGERRVSWGFGLVFSASTPVLEAWDEDAYTAISGCRVTYRRSNRMDRGEFATRPTMEAVVAASIGDIVAVVTSKGGHLFAHYWETGEEIPSWIADNAIADRLLIEEEEGELALTERGDELLRWHRLVGAGTNEQLRAVAGFTQAAEVLSEARYRASLFTIEEEVAEMRSDYLSLKAAARHLADRNYEESWAVRWTAECAANCVNSMDKLTKKRELIRQSAQAVVEAAIVLSDCRARLRRVYEA